MDLRAYIYTDDLNETNEELLDIARNANIDCGYLEDDRIEFIFDEDEDSNEYIRATIEKIKEVYHIADDLKLTYDLETILGF